MFQGLPPLFVTKDDAVMIAFDGSSGGLLNPPIITRTAATPMATPQGSPGEIIGPSKDMRKNFMVDASEDAWVCCVLFVLFSFRARCRRLQSLCHEARRPMFPLMFCSLCVRQFNN